MLFAEDTGVFVQETSIGFQSTLGGNNNFGIATVYSDNSTSNESRIILKSGLIDHFQSGTRNEANQNSFILYGFGDPLLIDSDYSSLNQNNLSSNTNYLGWNIQTKAHNTILVDGYGQTTVTPGAEAKITRCLNIGDFAYLAGDASNPEIYQGRLSRFVRHIFILDSSFYLLLDDLDSDKSVRYDWLLHSPYPFQIDAKQKKISICGNQADLSVQFLNPESLSYTLSSGFPSEPPFTEAIKPMDERQTEPKDERTKGRKDATASFLPSEAVVLHTSVFHLAAYPRLSSHIDWVDPSDFGNPTFIQKQLVTKKQAMNWLAVLSLSPKNEPALIKVDTVNLPSWLCGTIQTPKRNYYYLFSRNTGMSKLDYSGYSFTGKGAIVSMDTTGKINRFMLLDALQIRVMWLTMFNSSVPATMLAEIHKNNVVLQIAVDQDATVEISSSGHLKEIHINGIRQDESTSWKYIPETDKIQISLPAGTHNIRVAFLSEAQDTFQINPEN